MAVFETWYVLVMVIIVSAVTLLSLVNRVTVVLDSDTFWVDERSPIIYDHRLSPSPSLPSPTVRSSYLSPSCRNTVLFMKVCMGRIIRAGVQPTLDPYAEAFL